MPALKDMLHNNDGEGAQTIEGNKRTKQESCVDKLTLGDGPVNNLYDPSHKAIDREKHDVIKET